jgi:hypothetical protein
MGRLDGTLRILIVATLAGVAAFAVRKLFVEPDWIGQLCTSTAAPPWCLLRQGVVLGFARNVYGWASVAGAVVAVLFRSAPLAWFALAAGVFGCVLYRFDPAGAGVLLAALVLARLAPSGAAPGAEQGTGQQQA